MSEVGKTEVQRWALDASDWLWGMVRGAWNDKQTASQIIVDAVIGMIPLVGDVTAVRDLIAVSTRLAEDEHKREEVLEWVLLVVLLFALIPVVGGAIKGVGRLLIRAAKASSSVAKATESLAEIVQFLNRIGHGDAVKWIKSLNIMSYQAQIIGKFNSLMDTLTEALRAMRDKLGWLAPERMKAAIDLWITRFSDLKKAGAKMIPKAFTELNERLKAIQQAVYKGEWHSTQTGMKNVVREEEARVIEGAPRSLAKVRKGFKPNSIDQYHHEDGWPDLRKGAEYDADLDEYVSTKIAAFSGPMKAIELGRDDRDVKIYRVLFPSENYKASPWWTLEKPKNAKQWREQLAVLDDFNKNSFFLEYTIPKGTKLRAWKGKAAEQFDDDIGQYLPGGGEQVFVEFPADIKPEIMKLPELATGWGKTLKLFGFGDEAQTAITEVKLEKLQAQEIRTKHSAGN